MYERLIVHDTTIDFHISTGLSREVSTSSARVSSLLFHSPSHDHPDSVFVPSSRHLESYSSVTNLCPLRSCPNLVTVGLLVRLQSIQFFVSSDKVCLSIFPLFISLESFSSVN